jgi:hypothetical protein
VISRGEFIATILLAWELGGGLAHVINLLPLAQGFSQRGHRVYAALKDIGKAELSIRGNPSYPRFIISHG